MATPTKLGVSDNELVNSILDGGYAWADEIPDGITTVTFSAEGGPDGRPLAAWERGVFETAFATYGSFANIHYAFTAGAADIQIGVVTVAELQVITADEGDGGGDLTLAAQMGPFLATILPGDVPVQGYYANDFALWNQTDLRPGSYLYTTILHELGHGLGLAHPFDDGSSELSPVYPEPLSKLVTIMSYSGWLLDPETGYAYPGVAAGNVASLRFGQFLTPDPLDIAAVQVLYGANADWNGGDDVYRLPTGNDAGTGWTTIWDTGGVDWIKAGGGEDARVSLRPFLIAEDTIRAGSPSQVRGVEGGVMIADDFTGALLGGQHGFRGVLIENAAGGGGDDWIEGNAAANRLLGGAGDDSLLGGRGCDSLDGGGGADALSGGAGRDLLRGGARCDALAGGAGADRLVGGGGADVFVFRAGGGPDLVRDFGAGDRIDVRAAQGADSFAEIIGAAEQLGSGALLHFGADSVALSHVDLAALTPGDFIL